jgi:hypothetical protein
VASWSWAASMNGRGGSPLELQPLRHGHHAARDRGRAAGRGGASCRAGYDSRAASLCLAWGRLQATRSRFGTSAPEVRIGVALDPEFRGCSTGFNAGPATGLRPGPFCCLRGRPRGPASS